MDSLPKTLKRLNFKLEAIPDSITEEPEKELQSRVIQKENYKVSDNITKWIEKFGICDDILKEAKKRRHELNQELSDIDKQFNNLIHKIELEGKVDLFGGWIERNDIKANREKRRDIKDELLILTNVLRMDFRNLDRETINKTVIGLANRKFSYRIIEEEELNVV